GTFNGSSGIYRLTDDGPTLVVTLPDIRSNSIVAAAKDGSFWITFDTTDGLFRTTPSGLAKAVDGKVSRFCVASDEAVWFTGTGSGITRLAPNGTMTMLLPQSAVIAFAAGGD